MEIKQKGFIKILLIIVAIIAVAVFAYIQMGSRAEIIPSNITDNKASSSSQRSEKDVTAVQPSITFISPNSKSHYALGGIMTIKWEIKNLAKSMTGFLLCKEADYNNHSKCGEILPEGNQLNESTNQLEWKIEKSKYNYGANPSIPGKYKIISYTSYGSDKSVLDGYSEEFTIKSSSSATANWKTYTKYGFEFQYPTEWITSKDDSIIKYHWYLTDDLLFFSPNRESPKDSLVMAFSLMDNSKNNYTIDSLAACSNPEYSEERFISECEDIFINGVSYKKFISKGSASEVGGVPIVMDQKYVTVVTVYDNKSLVVSAKLNDRDMLDEEVILAKFDSILPTFKFTKLPISKLLNK